MSSDTYDSPGKDLIHLRRLKRLTFSLFGSIISIMILVGWHQLSSSYDQVISRAKINVNNLTSAIEVHAKDAISQSDTLLIGIVERIEWETLENVNIERLRKLFKHQSKIIPQIHGIFVYDRLGNWVVTDKDNIPYKANNKDREYFTYHEQFPNRETHIGKVIVSRSTGQLVIPVSRRLNNPDGSFAGVALITLRVDYFVAYFNRFNLGHNGNITLAHLDGTVLARRPFAHEVIGTNLKNGVIFSSLLPRSPSGTATFPSSVDGVTRIYSYAAFHRLPLVAIAGADLNYVLAPWWTQLKIYLVASLCILAALFTFLYLLVRQINRSAVIEASLARLSNEDPLTGLANRRKLNECIKTELGRAKRTHQPLSILMLDIDYFKKYNDEYGHIAGDECIKEVGKVFASASRRDGDVAARFGGEEMVLLLPGCNEKDAYRVAETIRERIWSLGIRHTGNPRGYVTASIGYYCYIDSEGDVGETGLIKGADDALYKAKNRGRNNVFPSPGDFSQTQRSPVPG